MSNTNGSRFNHCTDSVQFINESFNRSDVDSLKRFDSKESNFV